MSDAIPEKLKVSYVDVVHGKEIYNYFGNRVIEHTTSTGVVLAVKVKPRQGMKRSEGDMMHYAATHNVLAPKVRAIYDLRTHGCIARAMVSERVPGQPLVDVWMDLTKTQKSSIKDELRTQIARMRLCTQPFIGRVGHEPTRNVYDRLPQTYCGPFDSEEEFDEWCLARVKAGSFTRWRCQRMLERERRQQSSPGTFVLTHGDLTPRNVMVQDGVITGIVDWEKSGFFPEYAEYAFATKLCHGHEKWWIPVLKEVLQPCSRQRLEFTKLTEDRGW